MKINKKKLNMKCMSCMCSNNGIVGSLLVVLGVLCFFPQVLMYIGIYMLQIGMILLGLYLLLKKN